MMCPAQELCTIQVAILEINISDSIITNATIFNAQNTQQPNIQHQLVETQPEGIGMEKIIYIIVHKIILKILLSSSRMWT